MAKTMPELSTGLPPSILDPACKCLKFVKTTLQEMETSQVAPHLRDYCVDKYMVFLACKRLNFPLNYRCKHEVHAYHDCQYEDLVLRMKEYERERRLGELAVKHNVQE